MLVLGAVVVGALAGRLSSRGSGGSAGRAARPVLAASPTVRVAALAVPGARAALLEPAPDFPGYFLPRIGPDGLAPRTAYAAAPAPCAAPRVGLVLAFGLDRAQSEAAAAALPAPVGFAVSAYAGRIDPLLAAARAAGHELLMSLPMEPVAYPADQEGDEALLTGRSEGANARALEWVLSRQQAYIGVTSLSDGQLGARFTGSPSMMRPVRATLAGRGLFYLGASSGDRPATILLDDAQAGSGLAAQLASLGARAAADGSAIGLVGRIDPVVLAALRTWIGSLDRSGIRLCPVSVLLQAPGAPATP